MSEVLLGIDIGTSSSKGVLARPDGEVIASAERAHTMSMPHPGWAEHDAEDTWWGDFTGLCSELLPQADGGLAGVCTSGIGPCFLAADDAGDPLRPAILYGVDTRATREVDELTERLGQDAVVERCGNPLTAQSVGPKMAWLRRNEPEVWERTRLHLMAHSFVVRRLTGEYVLDHPSASMCEPLYDTGANDWIRDWAEEVAPGLALPRLLWPGEAAGEVTPDGAEATGIPAGTPVAAGTTDAWSEAVSVGIREPGDLMLMYATTMVVWQMLSESLRAPNLWSTAGFYPGTHALVAGMSTSGALTDWVKDLVGDVDYGTLVDEAGRVEPGSHGLVVLPYFAGERTPISDPRARGVVAGLTMSHQRGHLYRGMLEATAYGVRHILEAMREAGGRAERFVAVGGGTKGGLWTQIVSDVTGWPQELPVHTIGASYGDALLAGVAAGIVEPGTSWSARSETVEPDEALADHYDELYGIYRDLYTATTEQVHALADMQAGAAG
ncbi:FGGY-family carbohydrate kinase [soil metagenome]